MSYETIPNTGKLCLWVRNNNVFNKCKNNNSWNFIINILTLIQFLTSIFFPLAITFLTFLMKVTMTIMAMMRMRKSVQFSQIIIIIIMPKEILLIKYNKRFKVIEFSTIPSFPFFFHFLIVLHYNENLVEHFLYKLISELQKKPNFNVFRTLTKTF